MIDFARVQKELVECSKDSEGSGIKVSQKSDDLVQLIGIIPGPVGTPYEGGTFQIDITLPGAIISYSFCLFLSLPYIVSCFSLALGFQFPSIVGLLLSLRLFIIVSLLSLQRDTRLNPPRCSSRLKFGTKMNCYLLLCFLSFLWLM